MSAVSLICFVSCSAGQELQTFLLSAIMAFNLTHKSPSQGKTT